MSAATAEACQRWRGLAVSGTLRAMSERDHYIPSRDDLWRLPEVMQRTGLSQSSIYRHVAASRFPKPVHIGPRAVAWVAGEMLDWIAARPRSQ